VETISGRVVSGAPDRLTLHVNDKRSDLAASGSSFGARVSLQPGRNRVRVVGTDARGVEASDEVTVEYRRGIRVVLTRPVDGHTLSADDPPVVLVEGQVSDPTVSEVWIVGNDRRTAVPVRNGRFLLVTPALEPVLRLRAETLVNGRTAQHSETVTVRSGSTLERVALVIVPWATSASGAQVDVTASWRRVAEKADAPVVALSLDVIRSSRSGIPAEVFYLRNPKPGVYTFELRYRGPADAEAVAPSFHIHQRQAATLSSRKLDPVTLSGAGKVLLTKVLFPFGVLWDQEDWFSGRVLSADSITKFRMPDGVTWMELKGR
jgi:hypothetical protein